ncbi:kinase-like domain-containing protein, partial [Baffinella frigidus]
VADTIAQQFNEFCTDRCDLQCRFLPVCVMHIQDESKRATLLNSEPYLKGEYVKHNDNDGHVETNLELPQAFSHFTWEFSKASLLVCDIQGVGNFFTDPQIHSHDGESFSMGNLGQAGIDRFFKSHKCNNICRLIGLAKPVFQFDRWVIGQGSQCEVRRTVNRVKRAESGNTATVSPNWTARKYDGAIQQWFLESGDTGTVSPNWTARRYDGAIQKGASQIKETEAGMQRDLLARGEGASHIKETEAGMQRDLLARAAGAPGSPKAQLSLSQLEE